jgi:uncharacterized protein YjeT (DUF2065 family)
MNTTMLAAFGLVLVFEGLMPFVAPRAWRETFKRMIQLKDGQLRFVGLLSILAGLFLLFLSH